MRKLFSKYYFFHENWYQKQNIKILLNLLIIKLNLLGSKNLVGLVNLNSKDLTGLKNPARSGKF